MNRRRILGLAAGGLAAALTLTACGTGSGVGGSTTLTMIAADYGDGPANTSQKYWDDIVSQFEQKNPGIKVDVKVYSWNVVDKKLAEMVKSRDAPDIAQAGAYADYAARGDLYSADNLLSIPTEADFINSMATAGQVNRTQYGMPWVSSSRMFFYNKTLFQKAGIVNPDGTAKPPTTWDELKADAVKLKAAGVKVPFGLPFGPEEPAAETLIWMLGGGGNYVDDVSSYTIDSPQNVQTFTWLKNNLVDTGLTGGNPADTNRQTVFNGFSQGQVGMLNGHPTLIDQAKQGHIDYGIAKIPGQNGPLGSTLGVADWMMAFKKRGHAKQIGTFLDFVYSEQNQLKFLDEYNLLPVTVSASDVMEADPSRKDLAPFIAELPTATFYPDSKTSWGPVNATLKQVIGKAVTQDPSGVLSSLQRTAEAADSAAAAK
ncbi:sugar ABC transporter substrate-binding protein [Streptomyces sp. RB6PN25]|uniref:Sugar ABC transporter substrate-binding protein n=1 Tax=Streptomyces humicola TaxID=2953240 RepID=A0ABT1Q5B3_9ACTN|nr:sugar ABC transporter substrate-binding protein [Streptomyces humicola]MCQ4085080.1 sugar ABC transporter substrate-binding protein [Streptomyces humicola]